MNTVNIDYPEIAPNVFPQQCPVCLHDIQLKPLCKTTGSNGQMWLFQCPRQQCRAVFSLLFHKDGKLAELPSSDQTFFDKEELSKISEHFVETYDQAEKAERLKLTEIYGEAYRKATEYLVKDFLIKFGNLNKNEDQILKMNLSDAAKKLPDKRLVDLALASTWLGNDQTHPLQKHPEYGVKELKKFIEELAAFSIYTMRAKQAEEFVNSDD